MGRYLLRQLIGLPIVLLVMITIGFFMMRLAPGSPFNLERDLPEEVRKNLDAKYGLDDPLIVQYGRYLAGVAQGDLGPSTKFKDRTVNEIIGDHIGPTVVIGVCATLISLAIGLLAGIIGAVRQNGLLDYGSMSIAMFGMSVPRFVTGPLLMLAFALHWQLLPVQGYAATIEWWPLAVLLGGFGVWRMVDWARTGGPWSPDFDGGREAGIAWFAALTASASFAVVLLIRNDTLILPSLVLALPFGSRIARLMRAGMLEVINQDYIRTARAKGLTERVVILRHALKGGILPVVSFLGPAMAALLTGGLVVEKIFGIPGIAREFIESALNRDYWVALGTVVLYGSILVVFNLVVDIAYGFLDPRIRYD